MATELAKLKNKEDTLIFPITTAEGVIYKKPEEVNLNADNAQTAIDELASGIATKADIQDLEEGVDSDLDITDGENVLLRLSNGHIRTKNFNSANTAHPVSVVNPTESYDFDLDISDSSGYNLVRFANGHIKTKYFDSSNISAKKDYLGLEEIDPNNPLAKINQGFSMASIFKTWGFIGDSLASGETQCANGKFVDNFKYSWGLRMCKLLGVEGYNYSYGGMTAKSWYTNEAAPTGSNFEITSVPDGELDNGKRTKTLFDADEAKDAYIIALGVNDLYSLKQQYDTSNSLTALGNFDLVSSAYNTMCRYYHDIIVAIKEKLPKAHIFIVTAPVTSGKPLLSNLNTQLKSLPSKAQTWGLANASSTIHIIDLASYMDFVNMDSNFRTFIFGNTTSGHFTAAGYEYMAHVFMTYIDWIIRMNPSKFKDVALIGTDYTYIS